MRIIVLEGLIVLVMMLCMVACGNQADSTPAEEQGKTSVVAQKLIRRFRRMIRKKQKIILKQLLRMKRKQ